MNAILGDCGQVIHFGFVDKIVPDQFRHCLQTGDKNGGICFRISEPFPWWSERKQREFCQNKVQRMVCEELHRSRPQRGGIWCSLFLNGQYLVELMEELYSEHGYELIRETHFRESTCSFERERRTACCKRIELGFVRIPKRKAVCA
jgi:hypothetical protein